VTNEMNDELRNQQSPLKAACRRIAVANQKGGVGKTTTTINLGAALDKAGKRVLIVDGDPQGSLTSWLGLNGGVGDREIGRVLSGLIPFVDAIHQLEESNLHVIPIDHAMNDLKWVFEAKESWETSLRKEMNSWPLNYDYIIFDCPASYNPLLVNFLVAADEVVIPVQTEILSLNSTIPFLERLSEIRNTLNPNLKIAGILPVMFDSRTRHSQEILNRMREAPNLSKFMFATIIRKNVRLTEGPMRFRTILRTSPSSSGAMDYMALAEEIIRLEGKTEIEANSPDKNVTLTFAEDSASE